MNIALQDIPTSAVIMQNSKNSKRI